jgi:hypothetical protein
MPVGTSDSIEIQGDRATLSLVTEQLHQNYAIELYAGNTLLASMPLSNPERVAPGYFIAGTLDTSELKAALVPYQVLWKFYNSPNTIYRESAALWIVNPSIIQAIEDVKSKVNKARQTLYGTPDSQFSSTEILKWLRRGMDMFNNAYGVLTAFDMTNALGGVREPRLKSPLPAGPEPSPSLMPLMIRFCLNGLSSWSSWLWILEIMLSIADVRSTSSEMAAPLKLNAFSAQS